MAQAEHVAAAKSEVYRRYPEMAGIEPSVEEGIARRSVLRRQGDMFAPPDEQKVYVLTFRKELTAPDGVTVAQIVRVTLDQEGKIIKTVMSR